MLFLKVLGKSVNRLEVPLTRFLIGYPGQVSQVLNMAGNFWLK